MRKTAKCYHCEAETTRIYKSVERHDLHVVTLREGDKWRMVKRSGADPVVKCPYARDYIFQQSQSAGFGMYS
jgi:hypothetical protein